ncbi:MAG: prepilin-type N-terminal cleavage/methylation domain-containing protein [Opitutae bacterium]|nr:prepilin-type N-terminal cleavage/methylation domain-containing protein [Opitutae bacterium]
MSISTTTRDRRAGCQCGFTLVEAMVAALLGGLVLFGVLSTNLQLMKSGVRMTQYAEMNSQVGRGLDQLGHDLKSASDVALNSASDLTITITDAAGTTTQVTYAWTSASQSFFRVAGTDSTVTTGRTVLVTGIPALANGSPGVSFARFDRDGVAATTNAATKRIQVLMNITRTAVTTVATNDSAVSATFVLRNKPVS